MTKVLLTGDQYIELLLKRQAEWVENNPEVYRRNHYMQPLLEWFVRDGDEEIFDPENC
jgi:hypothetical protein